MNQEILDRLFPDLTSNQKYVLDLFIEYCETKLIKVSCENERLTETVEQLGNDAQSLVLEIERLRDENKELKIKVRTMSNVNRLLLLQQQENRQSLGGGCSHGEKVGSKSVEKPPPSSSSSSCHHRRTTTAVSCEKKETPNRIVTRSRAKAKDGSSVKKIVDDKVEAVKKTSSPKTTVQQTKRSTSMGKLVKQPKDKSQPLVKENISFEENKKRGLVSDVTKKRLQADKPKKVSPVVEEKSKKAKISPATGKENKKPKDATCDLKKIIRKRTTTGGLTLRAVNVAESPKIKSDKTSSKASKSLQESLNTTFKVSR